jgi:TPR repeat protein/S1-C subfamily serine protease
MTTCHTENVARSPLVNLINMKNRLLRNLVFAALTLTISTPSFADRREAVLAGLAAAAEAIAREAEKQAELERQKELIRYQFELEQQRVRQQQELFERRQREAAEVDRQRKLAAEEASKKKADEDRRTASSTGTGFFITTSGFLVTNAHVIADYENIEIRDQTGQTYRASVIATDKKRDLALLKVVGSFAALHIDQLGKPVKGQRVLTIGYPQISIQGSESKVTDGVISSLSGIRNNDDWFQISVPIQGGNSGGPLINENGLVIGVVVATVNAQRFLSTTGNLPQNINYAIKSRVLLSFLEEQQIRLSPAAKKKQTIESVDLATVLVIAKNATPLGVASANLAPQIGNKEQSPKQGSAIEGGVNTREAKANELFNEGNLAYQRREFAQAFAPLTTSAELGHKGAQYLLGFMFANGQGTGRDDATAVKWYRLAAVQGHAMAQTNLGLMYQTGKGVPQDDAEAVKWYRLAAVQGDAVGQTNLGTMYLLGKGVSRDDVEAVKWYRLAAAKGFASAQANLAFSYQTGKGVPQDDVEAVKWYRIAAAQGHAFALNGLGDMHRFGNGVLRDEAEAVRWYRLAAAQGLADAQNNLGVMCQTGKGVPQDDAEAAKWYRLAAAQGHADAQARLYALSAKSKVGQKNEVLVAK